MCASQNFVNTVCYNPLGAIHQIYKFGALGTKMTQLDFEVKGQIW